MMPHLTPRQLTRIVAVGLVVLVVALTIVRSRHSEPAVVLAPVEHGDAQAPAQELARCRTITSEETAALEICRRVWAKNRRQFFGAARAQETLNDSDHRAPASPADSQDRVLQREIEHRQGEAR